METSKRTLFEKVKVTERLCMQRNESDKKTLFAKELEIKVCVQVKRVAGEQGNRARALMSQLSGLLTEGAVTADTLLDSVPRILSVVRESNVALRWLFLHMAALPPAVALVIKPLTQSLELSLPDPSCVRMNSHQPLAS